MRCSRSLRSIETRTEGSRTRERNVRFVQSLVGGSVQELRQRTESSLAMTQEFADRVGEQGYALRMLAEESVEAYMNLLYAPSSYYKEGLQAAKNAIAR